ncbi:hypothetical protein KC361_g8935 [Hortaea werneckii]|nr:hypothetical protein KC361_g8935 [Hortaea werneckii]
MMRRTFTDVLLFSAGMPFTSAQQSTIQAGQVVGCESVGCPNISDSVNSTACQVADKKLGAVAVTSYHSDLLNSSVTWTLGVSVPEHGNASSGESDDQLNTVQHTFYMGTEPGVFDDNDIQGWTIFQLSGGYVGPIHNGTYFRPSPLYGWEGDNCTQPGGLPDTCVAWVKNITTHYVTTAGEPNDADMGKVITNSNDTDEVLSCRSVNDDLHEIVYPHSLTGPNASQPISASQNSSSNCWPTLTKSNQLTEVFSFNISARPDSLNQALAGIEPVYNIWYSKSQDKIEFHDLCLQPPNLESWGRVEVTSGGTAIATPFSWSAFILGSAVWLAMTMLM